MGEWVEIKFGKDIGWVHKKFTSLSGMQENLAILTPARLQLLNLLKNRNKWTHLTSAQTFAPYHVKKDVFEIIHLLKNTDKWTYFTVEVAFGIQYTIGMIDMMVSAYSPYIDEYLVWESYAMLKVLGLP